MPVFSTNGPTWIVSVARAAAARAISGDSPPGRSAIVIRSKPARSARTATSINSSTSLNAFALKPRRISAITYRA
jgi:hypothetical protein